MKPSNGMKWFKVLSEAIMKMRRPPLTPNREFLENARFVDIKVHNVKQPVVHGRRTSN
jgi:hypothetical protein